MRFKFLLTQLIFILFSFYSFSQVANPTNGDRPIYLRFQTFDKPANITVDIPSSSKTLSTFQLTANSSYTLNLTPWILLLENDTADFVLNRGLHIIADQEISVYYELFGTTVWGGGTNSDIFTLKGRNALGLEFYASFQTRWDNQIDMNAWASFDIIATQDQTQVEITPSKNIVNHAAVIPFTIQLNKGQTWSGRALTINAADRPTGSYIKSNKPIALTIKDDSMLDSLDWDMGGDQTIPVTQLGTEYIVMKHTDNSSTLNDFAYVLATADSTAIYLSGNTVPDTILSRGAQKEYPISEPLYIKTSHPVYVLHCTAFGKELAEAIVPTLTCTGSKEVGFIRSDNEILVINVLTTNGNQGNFTLDGSTSMLTASDFTPVPGTTNWVQASKLFTPTQIPAVKPNLLSNSTGSFHLSIMNGLPDSTGFRYGYFSDYGFVDLGPDSTICKGDSVEISAGIQDDSYLWTPSGSTNYYIFAKDSGMYTVTVKKSTCIFKDTIRIHFYPNIGQLLTNVTDTICDKQLITIKANPGFNHFQWSTGATIDSVSVGSAGYYYLKANDANGCAYKDSTKLTVLPLPKGSIEYNPADNIVFCTVDSIVNLQAPLHYQSYLWYNGSTASHIQVPKNNDGLYWVTLTDSLGCKNTINLNLDCSTYIEVPNLITLNGDGKNDYFQIKYLLPNTYRLEVFNRWGNLVYRNNAYYNDWNPSNLEDGVYYYGLTHYQNKYNLKGWVQIVR